MSERKSQKAAIDRGIERIEARRRRKEEARAEGSLAGQQAREKVERLLTRTATGIIYVAVFVVSLFAGPLPTTLVVSAMSWLCCSEFYRMVRRAGRMPNEVLGLTAAALFPLAAYLHGLDAMILLVFVLMVSMAIWYVATPRANVADVAVTIFGPIYISLCFSSLVLIRCSHKDVLGAQLALLVIASVWLNDSCAYLFGSRFGKHKLAVRISPNKTQEGFYAGLLASLIVWLVAGIIHLGGLGVPLALATGLVTSLLSVVGDLFESRIKRGVGVKDSGSLMPGHGGLLDRSDSTLFASVAAYFMFLFGGLL